MGRNNYRAPLKVHADDPLLFAEREAAISGVNQLGHVRELIECCRVTVRGPPRRPSPSHRGWFTVNKASFLPLPRRCHCVTRGFQTDRGTTPHFPTFITRKRSRGRGRGIQGNGKMKAIDQGVLKKKRVYFKRCKNPSPPPTCDGSLDSRRIIAGCRV